MAPRGSDTEHRQLQHNQSNQLSLPQQDNCLTRKGAKNHTTKQGPSTKPPHTIGVTTLNDQQQTHNLSQQQLSSQPGG